MARTVFLPSQRVIPEDIFYATRCFFPCPCGGTVPDVPSYCKHGQTQTRAKTSCADVMCCVQSCEYNNVCEAYAKYIKMTKKRREADALSFELRDKKDK